ncbi:MAG TPA: polysaccharide biosynthesis C-terminal domain-containing protein [Methanomicrobiales archaeon]|nr:polysaccharide biosynthesis C-terminal domain-containing protein [Methanomicrobiales archaeon]
MEVQRHGLMYLFSTVGITIAGFFATMFYAHWVGAVVLGAYFLFLSYYGILSLFSDSGIGSAGVKRISEGMDQDAYYTACLVLRLLVYLVTIALFILFRDRFADLNQAGLFSILIIVVGIGIVNAQIGTSIAGCNRLGLAASTSLINNLVRIGIQVVLVFLGYQVAGLVGGLVAGILVQIIIESRFIDLHLSRFTWDHVRSIFTYSTWAFLTSSGNTIFEYVDILVISYFLAVSEVGVYGICWTFSSCAIFVSTALSNTLFVKVSRWDSAGDRGAVGLSLSRAITYSLMFSVPILLGGLFLGGPLLYFLYGADFSAGGIPLLLLIGMRVIQSVQQIYFTYLMALDHARKAFYVTGTMAVTNLVLDLLLVPAFGIAGAAFASLVTIGTSTVFAHLQLRGFTGITPERRPLFEIAIAAILMTATLMGLLQFITITSAVQAAALVGAGAAIYLGSLTAMDEEIRRSALGILEIRWRS